jgi:1-acyl-sn-glycerol-3-phosphate acyltransferase
MDGFWLIAFAWYWGLSIRWLVKESMVRGPGRLLLLIGAVPVDRARPEGTVDRLAAEFRARERMVLAIPPEGTRSRRDYWKSGFRRVAQAAGVPVCLAVLDYRRKQAGFGPGFEMTDSVQADMDRVRAFYAGATGKLPADFTPPRLREEDEALTVGPRAGGA